MSDQISSKNLWKNLFEKKEVVELSERVNPLNFGLKSCHFCHNLSS